MSTHDDELIDRAAQAMTRGEPSARLRHAVRARIEPRGPGRAKQALLLWVPIGVAAAIVLSVLAWRGDADKSRPTQLATAPVEQPGLRELSARPGLQETARPGLPETARPGLQETARPGQPEDARARPEMAPAHLPVRVNTPRRTPQRTLVVEPLVIEPISVPLIAVDASSGVMPIEIMEMQIEPLRIQ